jgi:hypothetical protein
MTDTALSALARAWATTVILIYLLVGGLAFVRAWDGSIYAQELQEVVNFDE